MNVRLWALIFTMVFGFFAAEARAQQLSADEAVRLGLEHNTRIRASRADVAEAEAARRVARASALPSLEARASYTRLSDNIPEAEFSLPGFDTTFTLLPVELDRYHTEVSLEQPIFAGGRILNQVRAARHQAEAARLAARQEEADVALEIRQAYWRLFESRAVASSIESALSQIDAHIGVVEARVREGVSLRGDLLSARTRRSEILLDEIDVRNAVELARLELNRLIGRPLNAEVEAVAMAHAESVPSLSAMLAEARDGHPSVEALERQVAALEAMHRVTRGAWLPEVAAVGRYVYARPNQYFFLEQDEFRSSWEAGVSMRWSLFAGGRRSAETAQARARITGAQARLDELRLQIEVLLTQRHLEARRATESIAVAAEVVETAEEALRVARASYREGVILGAEVLDAEQAYSHAQARHARAVTERALAWAALLNAFGRVW
jgi:outer membrane protein